MRALFVVLALLLVLSGSWVLVLTRDIVTGGALISSGIVSGILSLKFVYVKIKTALFEIEVRKC